MVKKETHNDAKLACSSLVSMKRQTDQSYIWTSQEPSFMASLAFKASNNFSDDIGSSLIQTPVA